MQENMVLTGETSLHWPSTQNDIFYQKKTEWNSASDQTWGGMGVNKGRGNDGTGHHPWLRGGRGSSHKSGQSNGSLKKNDVTTLDGNFFIF